MSARLWLTAFFLLAIGAAHAQGTAVATVNGVAIPQSRLDRAVAALSQRGVKDTPEMRQQLREELIAREVVQQEALRLQLDKQPAFAAAMEEQRTNLLIQAFMQEHLRNNPVPDSEVKAEYDRQAAAAAEKKSDQKIMTFEQAAPKLRAALEQQRMREAAAALRKQATVQ